jgi:tyrosyl-tRNA synthetase
MPEVTLKADGDGLPIAAVLKQAGLTPSTSDALRMLAQGGVKMDGEKITDKALQIARGASVVLQVGKRKFARVTVS